MASEWMNGRTIIGATVDRSTVAVGEVSGSRVAGKCVRRMT